MEIYGHSNIEPGAAPLPNDPHKALAELRRRAAELPFAVGIKVGSPEEAVFDATLEAVAKEYPDAYARAADFSGRSVACLMSLLEDEIDETGQPLTLSPERLVPLVGAFLGEIATGPKAKDPLATAWRKLRPAEKQTPREKPPTKYALRERMAKGKLQTWLEQDPSQVLSDIRTAISKGQFNLNREAPEIHTPVIDQLSAQYEQIGPRTPYQSRSMASEFIKAVYRYSKVSFGLLPDMTIRASLVLPHTQPYFDDVLQLEQAGLTKPYRRALAQSPKEIELLRARWVHKFGMPDWAFVRTADSNVIDIQAAMQELHRVYGTAPPTKIYPLGSH